MPKNDFGFICLKEKYSMPDKKIVDDYYSSVSSDDTSKESTQKPSLKIKPKKIAIKMKAPAPKAEPVVVEKTPVIEPAPVSKMVVIPAKKVEPVVNKVTPKPITPVKKPENTPYKGGMTITRRATDAERASMKRGHKPYQWGKKPTSPRPGPKWPAPAKVFTDNKTAWGSSNNKFNTQKRSTLSPYQGKKARGRFKSISDNDSGFKRSNKLIKKEKQEKNIDDIKQTLVNRTGQTVVIQDTLSLKELSDKLWVPLSGLIAEFMKNGMMLNINSPVDFESASIVAEAFEIVLQRDKSAGMAVEEVLEWNLEKLLMEDDDSKLENRPPVISIMGHVDHGKTSLLDYIREAKVVDGEAGWITQSIGAYQVEKDGQKITFLDTPGHEAFTVMRARGAKSTDIAILVVAANEWVKPQTIESINHAKEAGIPVIVAINKMDLEWANPDHLKGQLSEHGLTPEDWGGDTPMVPVSAKTGFGIDDLLEIIVLVAEMKELKANPNRSAVATVIESHLDSNLGPVATILINAGTLHKGDDIVCKDALGKVKVMKNHLGVSVNTAIPGDPVLIVGLDRVIEGWDILQAVSSVSIARKKVEDYKEIARGNKALASSGLELLMSKIQAGNLQQLKVVVKADSNGSLEAMKASLTRLSTEETSVLVIHSWVGDITQSDAVMSESSQAILVWFNVDILSTAKKIVESSKTEYINSPIIYHITERIEKIVTGMLDPKEVEVALSTSKVLAIFYTSKEFMVVGIHIPHDSKVVPNAHVRVLRKKELVWTWKLLSVQQWIEEVKEVEGETECGVKFAWNVEILEGDVFEVYKLEIQK